VQPRPDERRAAPRPQQRRPARPPRPRRRPRLGDPQNRLKVGLVVVFVALSVLGARLVQLQGLDSAALASEALDKRLVDVELAAHRGDITDAQGRLLAWTVERRNILIDQTLVGNYDRKGTEKTPSGIAGAAHDLAPVLGMDVKTLTAKLTGARRGAYVKKDVPPDVYRRARALRVPGLGAEQASRRVYPAGSVGAQVVGFVSGDGRPLAGVERLYDDQLRGTDGKAAYERSEDGARIPTGVNEETDPVDGTSIRLTIDQDIQWKAQQVLDAEVARFGAETGYVVVMEPAGTILALASGPGFDAQNPGRSTAANRENRALTDVFEPGSTSKVVTLAAALEEKVATPDTEVTIPPVLKRADRTFHDSHAHGVEQLTVAGVMAKSSNIGTILLGEQVPKERMYDYMRAFGLGTKTGVGLGESAGLLSAPAKWDGSQRYTVLFGQGLAVTALQSADVFATIANDGVRVAPRIIAGTTPPDGTFVPSARAPVTRVVSADTARKVRLMMESVVGEEGTAVKAEIPGYRVAGKTGTSQLADPSCGCYRSGWYTASFIGMAPADKPSLVVAVVLQKPKKGYYGGTVAAPAFQEIMSYALTKRQVPPTGTTAPTATLTWD